MDDIDPAFNPVRQLDCATVKTPISDVVGPLTLFTTPVAYLYLDRL